MTNLDPQLVYQGTAIALVTGGIQLLGAVLLLLPALSFLGTVVLITAVIGSVLGSTSIPNPPITALTLIILVAVARVQWRMAVRPARTSRRDLGNKGRSEIPWISIR